MNIKDIELIKLKAINYMMSMAKWVEIYKNLYIDPKSHIVINECEEKIVLKVIGGAQSLECEVEMKLTMNNINDLDLDLLSTRYEGSLDIDSRYKDIDKMIPFALLLMQDKLRALLAPDDSILELVNEKKIDNANSVKYGEEVYGSLTMIANLLKNIPHNSREDYGYTDAEVVANWYREKHNYEDDRILILGDKANRFISENYIKMSK